MGNGASDMAWRERAVVKQVRAHGEVCSKLHQKGFTCEPNFSQAIKKAYDNKVITKSNVANYKAINRHGTKQASTTTGTKQSITL